MPRSYLMSWEGEPHFRWVKMFRGLRYRITCSEMGLSRDRWTKEESAATANQWWEYNLPKILEAHAMSLNNAPELKQLGGRLDYAKRHGME